MLHQNTKSSIQKLDESPVKKCHIYPFNISPQTLNGSIKSGCIIVQLEVGACVRNRIEFGPFPIFHKFQCIP